jgi:hypothetical protein
VMLWRNFVHCSFPLTSPPDGAGRKEKLKH